MGLFDERFYYKPFEYPIYYEEGWLKQALAHWLHFEIPMQPDIKDWKENLTEEEKHLVGNILLGFAQTEVMVSDYWSGMVAKWFPKPEIKEMALMFGMQECFDKETELLTTDGWIKVPEITSEHKIAQYDIKKEFISFVKPKKVVSYDYKGDLHYYENKSTNICVTPNHDLILKHPSTKKVKKDKSENGKWGRNYLYPSAGLFVEGDKDLSFVDRLLIAVAADGSLFGATPSGAGRTDVVFSLKKQRKIDRLLFLIEESNLRYTIKEKENDFFRISVYFDEGFGWNLQEIKNLDFVDVESFSLSSLKAIKEEIMFWDGSSNRCFCSTNKKAIDKFQTICVLTGTRATVSRNRTKEQSLALELPQGGKPKSAKDCYVVWVGENLWKTYPHRKNVEYDDKVYCVSVEHENLVTRREGKISFTGNTIHSQAYSYLNETLDLTNFEAFIHVPEITEKFDLLMDVSKDYDPNDLKSSAEARLDVAKSLAVFSAFAEGVSLFSSFAVLYSFQMRNMLKGMGQQMKYSVRDESLHSRMGCVLFRHMCEEYPELKEQAEHIIVDAAKLMCEMELNFIDKMFEKGDLENLKKYDLKNFIKKRTNQKFIELGYDYKIINFDEESASELDWFYNLTGGVMHTDFFALRVTDYSKVGEENWDDIWEEEKEE